MSAAGITVKAAIPVGLMATLRQCVDIGATDVSYQRLYEQWLCRDAWQLEREALPLLVGIDPSSWPAHCERHALAAPAERLLQVLAENLGCGPAASIGPRRLGLWARENGLELPMPFARVLDYLQRVLPVAGFPPASPAAEREAHDRERVLGAALALVTRFPDSCRGDNGMFDGQRIVELMRVQAAVWFPSGAPSLSDAAMVALLERYLS